MKITTKNFSERKKSENGKNEIFLFFLKYNLRFFSARICKDQTQKIIEKPILKNGTVQLVYEFLFYFVKNCSLSDKTEQ